RIVSSAIHAQRVLGAECWVLGATVPGAGCWVLRVPGAAGARCCARIVAGRVIGIDDGMHALRCGAESTGQLRQELVERQYVDLTDALAARAEEHDDLPRHFACPIDEGRESLEMARVDAP